HRLNYGRGARVGRGLGVGAHLPVHGVGVDVGADVAVAVGVAVSVGVAVAVAAGVGVGVRIAVGVAVAVAATVAVGVGVGVAPERAKFLPQVLKSREPIPSPPQTIISLPFQMAVWRNRAAGALVMLVPLQLSIPGSYLPPVFK